VGPGATGRSAAGEFWIFRFGSAVQQVIKIKTLTGLGKSKLEIDVNSAS
jgi:hypothetical protein